MTKHIPTTKQIKNSYVQQQRNLSVWTEGERRAKKDFDNWLAQHDAETEKATEERIIKLLQEAVEKAELYAEETYGLIVAISLIEGEEQ